MLLLPSAAWKSRTLMAATVIREGSKSTVVNQPRRSATLVMNRSTSNRWPEATATQGWTLPREMEVLPEGFASIPSVVRIAMGVGVGEGVGVGVASGRGGPMAIWA